MSARARLLPWLLAVIAAGVSPPAAAQTTYRQVPAYAPTGTALFASPYPVPLDRLDFDDVGLSTNLVVPRAELQALLDTGAGETGRFTPAINPFVGADQAVMNLVPVRQRTTKDGKVYSFLIIIAGAIDAHLPGPNQTRPVILAAYSDDVSDTPAGPVVGASFEWRESSANGAVQEVVRIRGDDGFRLNMSLIAPRNVLGVVSRGDPAATPAPNPFFALADGSELITGAQFYIVRATSIEISGVLALPHGTLHVVRVFNDPSGPLDNPNAAPAGFPPLRRNGSYAASYR